MRVSIIPADNAVIVDGAPLPVPSPSPLDMPGVRAIQWHDDHGAIEYDVGPQEAIASPALVMMIVNACRQEAARLAAEAEAARLVAEPQPAP